MRKLLKEKLNSRKGESIGEVLVALLISALALVMLASMITASTRMIQSSRDKLNEYYLANNTLTDRPETGSGSGTVTIKEGGAVVKLDVGSTDGTISVKYYKNDKAPANTQVVSY